MRALGLFTGTALTVTLLLGINEARADTMDPALGRLVSSDVCRINTGGALHYNPASRFQRCEPNHAAFAKLVSQFGAALAPTASHTARTTGYGGYTFGVEASYTTIDSDAPYWIHGTQGAQDSSTGRDSVRNVSPDSVLQLYSLRLAKGFPFGLEVGGAFGFLGNSEIISGGADIRFALFEGFRSGIPGFIPDVGVGGGVRTISGSTEMKLTIASFDATISKPIHIASTVTVHPHVGYQWMRIFGDSGLVDLTPNTDGVAHCGYTGDNTPATPDPDESQFDGQPNCLGSSADFNNNVVFNPVRLTRHRINFGFKTRWQMVQFGIAAATDVVSPFEANKSDSDLEEQAIDPNDPSGRTRIGLHKLADDPRTAEDDEAGSQWTISVELGAVF